ncbi:hypothetical protein [Clostridium gasigenes]|uniref:hypothetical protein n=1 Tax=Clostridium gasigenes TaxID=94869 RepID=UPI001C0B0C6F|nr:hypothetical protein [Clostridium gasigenes]MBU3107429.1 hypothetical protein [Clostridium gasigenes]
MPSNVVLYLASIFAASIVFINLVVGISFNSLFSFNKYSDILVVILDIVAIGILIW